MPFAPPSRRLSQRATIDLSVTLVRSRGLPVQGRSVDLGRGGMRVLCGRPLRVDDLLGFELVLPSGERVTGQARVLREDVRMTYGLRFEGLAPEAAEALARALAAVPVST
jgi:hypothetical protein